MPLEPRVTSVQLLAMISIAMGKTSVANEKNAPLSRKQGQLMATAEHGGDDHAREQAEPG